MRPVDIIDPIIDALQAMKAREGLPDRPALREMMEVLDVRDLARDGQALARRLHPSNEQERTAWQTFRLEMTYLELTAHAILSALPSSTPEEDQALMDKLAKWVNELGDLRPALATLSDSDTAPTRLH